jgi:hypothetical protein
MGFVSQPVLVVRFLRRSCSPIDTITIAKTAQARVSVLLKPGCGDDLKLETRNQGVAWPRVEEKPGLPEAFTAHIRGLADLRSGSGALGHLGTSCRRSIPTRKGL